MGKKKAETVYLETRWGIHTFFMKFPIDVIVLDDNNQVVKVKKNLRPWRVFFWNPRYYKVVETSSKLSHLSASSGNLCLISFKSNS